MERAVAATKTFDAGAPAYDRFMGRWSRLYIPALLAAAGVGSGQRVLDVATGTGEAAMLAASLCGPSGRVLGTDISLPMLRRAQSLDADGRIALSAMDGTALACRDQAFDAVVCQLGLMLIPDKARTVRECHRVLRPGGRMAAGVWSTADRAPIVGVLADALVRQLPADRESLYLAFSLADPGRLEALLVGGGFREVSVTTERRELHFDSFEDYWSPVEAGGARLGQAYKGLPEEGRRAVLDDVRQRLSQFEAHGQLVMPVEALLAVATR